MSGRSAITHRDRTEPDRPSSHTTARIATPESTLLEAAQASSASTTSSRSTGAFMMASQVRCTCMREKAEDGGNRELAPHEQVPAPHGNEAQACGGRCKESH